MKVSYKWLQKYFAEPLPHAPQLADLLTFHSFELEGVEERDGDHILDIDVLANRASDCLSHRGIARETATLLARPLARDPFAEPAELSLQAEKLQVTLAAPAVRRYSAAVVRGVTVGPSPQWLQEALASLGQRSINNVVDATNYVMFDLGQPLHAFDYRKLASSDGGAAIAVRMAREGETITTLTGEEYRLSDADLIIADGISDTPLGIAGIKGGRQAEVDAGTVDLIIESANFDAVAVRKTSRRLRLSTDASTRFQNRPSANLTPIALQAVCALIADIAGGAVEGYVDAGTPDAPRAPVAVTRGHANALLGTALAVEDIEAILNRFNFAYTRSGEEFTVTPPFERSDLNRAEDLIEEIGRVHGYRAIEAQPLPPFEGTIEINTRFHYLDAVRRVLADLGFSEVYTYTLHQEGAVELLNPLAADKNWMRARLGADPKVPGSFAASLSLNGGNAALFGAGPVKQFELGPVFTDASAENGGEHIALALGVAGIKKADPLLDEAAAAVEAALGTKLIEVAREGGVREYDFEASLRQAAPVAAYGNLAGSTAIAKYRPASPYPFVVRDIALWASEEAQASAVQEVIDAAAGSLRIRTDLFDEFHKDGRVSYAFRLVFQSKEKTLTDDEVNAVMEQVNAAVAVREWEVR